MDNDTFFFSCLALVMGLGIIPFWRYHSQKPEVSAKPARTQGGDEALLDAHNEILRLQFELQKTEQERDALSRAAIFFAGQTPQANEQQAK